MPYTVGCSPGPLTSAIRPEPGWQASLGIDWHYFIGYQFLSVSGKTLSHDLFGVVVFALMSFSILVSFISR